MNGIILYVAYWAIVAIGIGALVIIAGYIVDKALTSLLNGFKVSNVMVRFYAHHLRLKKQGKSIREEYAKPYVYEPKMKGGNDI